MIKKIYLTILILCGLANATKRVNMFCRFDAVAVGYKSSTHSVNLILVEPNNNRQLKLYNDDGSENSESEKTIYATGVPYFYIFDGKNYQLISINFDRNSEDMIQLAKLFYRNNNAGTFTCMMTEEWSPEYYKIEN